MNSGEKNARIVWRMKSVEATRVIPSRWATSAATVDLPVPVEPPISTMIGTSSVCRSASRCRRPTARSPSSSPSISAREHVEPLELDRPLATLGEIDLDPPRELVRTVGGNAGRDQRARHHALRIRQARRRRAAAARRGGVGSCDAARERVPAAARRCRRATTSLRREHDALAVRQRMLGDDVDRGGLQLDEIRVGVDRRARRAARRDRRGWPRRGRRRRRGARRPSRRP